MSHIEVFILNYNGAHFLGQCLESLRRVDRGVHSMHVSVIDNCSHDNSAKVVSRFEGVSFISLDRNYGFSGGNNRGVWRRLEEISKEGQQADYICFLNNDTAVERDWLTTAVERFDSDPTIGVVGGKANFFDPFIEVTFDCAPIFRPRDSGSLDSRDLGVFLHAQQPTPNVHPDPKRSKWIDAHPAEPCGGRWLYPTGRVLVAVQDTAKPTKIGLSLENRNLTCELTHVTMGVAGQTHTVTLLPGESKQVTLTVPPNQAELFIQNAGSFVTDDWNAGDEGTFSRDEGTFLEPREIAAVCGVSMFMRADLFVKLTGFDEAFFAYFEDTDLSLRARLAGYSCWYEPRSRLRHVHCGSGGEFSPYFNFNVTHSHLLFTARWSRSPAFFKRLAQVCQRAGRELKAFEADSNLITKPNLRTLVRMIKHPLRLPTRRFFNFCHRRSIGDLKRSALKAEKV